MSNPLSRVPRRLFGGRLHTGTVAMVVVFVALLAVYGQRSDHYARVDAESAKPTPVTTSTPTEEYVPTTAVRSTTRPSSSSSSAVPSTSTDPNQTSSDSGASGGAGSPGDATATTSRPGLPLPTVPGLRLPGQTPTTPPVR